MNIGYNLSIIRQLSTRSFELYSYWQVSWLVPFLNSFPSDPDNYRDGTVDLLFQKRVPGISGMDLQLRGQLQIIGFNQSLDSLLILPLCNKNQEPKADAILVHKFGP
jgi:hypothetical protein